MSEALYRLEGVRYLYEEVVALDGLTIDFRRGERSALLGANGSGKSTLLRMLAGLDFPESGEIRFDGELLSEGRLSQRDVNERFRARVGMVFQNPDVQLFNSSVREELAFGPLQLGWSRDRVLDEIGRMAERMNLQHLLGRPPHRLSAGEKKRVALASILILDPEVLLLDEPAATLDPASESTILDELVTRRGSGRTVIMATHDLETLPDIADTCVVLSRGVAVASGPPERILENLELLRSAGLARGHHHRHGSETHAHEHVHKRHDHEPGARD
ncbi:MAG: energy-coupling factor ABC transporter ATP-binding protein [Thermoanaerobaculia bacterium]